MLRIVEKAHKPLFAFVIILISNYSLKGQDIDSLENRVRFFETVISNLNDSIKSTKNLILFERNRLRLDTIKENFNIRTIVKEAFFTKEKPNHTSKTLRFLKAGTEIIVTGFVIDNDDYKYYKLVDGDYFNADYVKLTDSLIAIKENLEKKYQKTRETERIIKKRESEKAQEKNLKDRRLELVKKYGASNADKILNRKIWLGMTANMLKEVMGNPDKVNRTVFSFGVHEQWVYLGSGNDEYYYFENGILKSWQD